MVGGGLRVDVSEADDHSGPDSSDRRGRPVGDLSPAQHKFPSSKMKVDELFIQWLSLPESQKLVRAFISPRSCNL